MGFRVMIESRCTNRVDVLDLALLRSGRLDRKIEFPMPNEDARAKILQIHARKMTVMLGLIGLSWRGARIMGPC
jgi:ATP-dependent 26S proteasome regulatory subunit